MARASATPALRPFLAADLPVLAAIFREAIEDLTGEDYSAAQQAAWAGVADDEAAFGRRLAGARPAVAMRPRPAAGFAALKGADGIDMLYVHPAVARPPVATARCDA